MTDTAYSADSNLALEVVQQENRKRRALSVLLGDLRTRAEHHLAIQVHMGEVDSYITSVPLRWIAAKVGFAADLPIFRESIEGSKRIAVDQDTIETVQQRQPDWRRQQEMTAYLATRRHHKFPPLLLVAYQHWVHEDDSDKWAPDGTAMHHSLTLASLDPTGTYWDLDDSETLLYALDGQHRLMAIQGLNELITTGTLHALDDNRKKRSQPPLSRDTLIKRIQNSIGGGRHAVHERLQRLMDERIGIEIVPAVIHGETFVQALRRLRQLLVDVNEHAKNLTAGELAQLDENHGFRIVARRLMSRHKLLRSATDPDGVPFGRVHTRHGTLGEKSPSYTTLQALSTIVERYLVERRTPPQVSSWRPLVKGIYERPDDDSLEIGTSAMAEYFDTLGRLPSHEAFIQGKPAGNIRKADGDDNILFRPIAQTALAEAVGRLSRAGISLDTIAGVLAEQESGGQLKLTDPRTPWFGVLCDPVSRKTRRHRKNEELCCWMFQYLLGGGLPDDLDPEELRHRFVNERRVDDDHAVDLHGDTVGLDRVKLPNPWR